ncbi:energy-coupling factor ABC transporter ATP-binding protein [Corynebacterium kutscheri]|uniref:energy-coupling factor ABC transporter ATP-binding protein n=1 Tax=Corynebacterium kutscheri TaxID=35755 RepID=UPI0037C14147
MDIRFDSVSVNYDDKIILDNITTTLSEHRIGIIGANGGGKSTFIRLINGLGEASSGTVEVDGMNVDKQAKEIRKKVGFVFSDAENQIVMPTVHDDIAFSLRRHKLTKDVREAKVNEVMQRFQLANHRDHSPHMLSGGQKQLLALASVLVIEPELIIADEPTTLLDMLNRRRIRQIFDTLEQQLIVVTHDLDFLQGFDRVLCIDNHAIAADGSPEEVIAFYTNLMQQRTL